MKSLLSKELYIFDLDGTLYLGDTLFDDALSTVRRLREMGKRVMFLTNNSARSTDTYLDRLTGMGFAPVREEVLTSGNITARYLRAHCPEARVFLLGTPDLAAEFRDCGIVLSEECADVVVVAWDSTLTYDRLSKACLLIQQGARYLCTHPDLRCPAPGGFIPDCGAIAAAVTAVTGVVPEYLGKPGAQTVEIIEQITGIPRSEMLFVGDRLYTDIAVGKRNGGAAALVLTGEATREDAERAPEDERPDAVLASLSELFTD